MPDEVPFSSSSALVARQFRDFDGRAPSSAEASAWVGPIAACTKSADDLIVSLLPGSMTADDARLVRLYLAFFHRPPDPTGFAHWQRQLDQGRGLSVVATSFAKSTEFVRTYGKLSNRSFVKLVYVNVLERQGETAGVDFWTARLDAKKATRGDVMVSFSESPENIAKRVQAVNIFRMYRTMLQRFPSKSAFFTLLDPITAGTSTAADAAHTIRHSSAYAARISSLS